MLGFGARVLIPAHVRGLRVLEVGARNVNGSLRRHVTSLGPAAYLGVDIEAGPGVDRLADAEAVEFCAAVGAPFALVICTEMLEHVRDWRAAVGNLKRCVQPGGHLLITTRSLGFKLHEYPGDYWRYEVADMGAIVADLEILALESDPQAPGVFLYATSRGAPRTDLSGLTLYSMPAGARLP